MGIQHPLFIPRERTIDIVMKLILAATIIALSVAYAQSITCYQCPYGILPNEKCLNDGADPGKEHNCLNPLDNACETLAIGKVDIIYGNIDRYYRPNLLGTPVT